MTQRGWKRLEVVRRVEEGKLRASEAATVLGLSERQVKRLRKKYRRGGAAALVHGNTGRSPSHRVSPVIRDKIVELRRGKYAGFNDSHFTEKLEAEGLVMVRETVRRILRSAGEGPARPRRGRRHRSRRERSAQVGMMLLWDGSRHDWLEGRGPLMCLMGAVDDATGEVMPGAHFLGQESTAGYLRVLKAVCEERGIPLSVYMDQHGSLQRNDGNWTLEEELAGKQKPTQVGQAMEELGIEMIYALSPQAKGRVERLWGVLQDRLVSELRLAKATTREAAQAVLEKYLPEYNRRFAVTAREAPSAFREVRAGVDLNRVCAFRYEAVVANDNAVRICGEVIDIPPGPGGRSYAKARVDVRQFLDGLWVISQGGELLAEKQSTQEGELRAGRRRRLNAAAREFKSGVSRFQPPPPPAQAASPRKQRSARRTKREIPFNARPKQLKAKRPATAKGVTDSLAS